ncbi:hypothetical protein WH47_02315 [Habropoda laboriosa]|uniref:Mos1 transposase HTH domain-containing protein n=1 Tax=Habropoda laboriosa TaxID=597456 RepID=A0A0L7QJK3_9HYME|nr:hypothetical protein WH47_02315 [Habropoda laboriosa]
MKENRVDFRHLIFFFYQNGRNTLETANKVFNVYAEGSLSEKIDHKKFAKFRDENFDLRKNSKRNFSTKCNFQIAGKQEKVVKQNGTYLAE